MIFKILPNGQIWIQYILIKGTEEEKTHFSKILKRYGRYHYTDNDIIEFVTTCLNSKPNHQEARVFVESLNDELGVSLHINS